jgi:tetratricopeptide (TPR) repeat protein
MTSKFSTVVLMLAPLLLVGCSSLVRSPNYIRVEAQRDPQLASQLNQSGVRHVHRGDLAKAEAEFISAIRADEAFGPAHNNLGRVYFHRRDLRLAAGSFQRASELMPDRVEPINNLGLAYETGGRLDEALEMYQSAHGLAPDDPEYLGNLVRLRLRRGERNEQLQEELSRLVFIEVRPEWVKWAQYHLALSKPRRETSESPFPPNREIVQPEWLLPPPEEVVPLPTPAPIGFGLEDLSPEIP